MRQGECSWLRQATTSRLKAQRMSAACTHLSQHRARHCCSLLLRLLLGLVMHLSKHLSRTVCRAGTGESRRGDQSRSSLDARRPPPPPSDPAAAAHPPGKIPAETPSASLAAPAHACGGGEGAWGLRCSEGEPPMGVWLHHPGAWVPGIDVRALGSHLPRPSLGSPTHFRRCCLPALRRNPLELWVV